MAVLDHALEPRFQITALVAFGLPPSLVDELIDEVVGTSIAPARWVVFATDMSLLGALSAAWQNRIQITLCAMPEANQTMVDAAVDILCHENVQLKFSAWLQPEGAGLRPPEALGLSIDVPIDSRFDARALSQSLASWIATEV